MTRFAIIAFLFISVSVRGQEETLYWAAGRRLQFSDFRGQAKGTPGEKTPGRKEARIAGTIIKSIVADTRRINGRTFFVVYASMKPGLSWIGKKHDSITLRHEQGHFDLCEIYARRLRREIGQSASIDEAKRRWNRVLDEEELEQTRYDKINTYAAGGITRSWTARIREQLKALGSWSNPQVVAGKFK